MKKNNLEEEKIEVLQTNYPAKNPLNPSERVDLCSEVLVFYDKPSKRDLKIRKLFLMTESGVRFSNQVIEAENRERIENARLSKNKLL